MPYEIFLALRHIRSRQRRGLARVTAVLAVCGIAAGVAALIVALALANGFRDEMREKILSGTAHLSVMRADGQPMNDYQDVARRVSSVAGVTQVQATTYDGAVVVGPRSAAYAVLRGIPSESTLTEVRNLLVEGSADSLFTRNPGEPPNVIIGAELAARTGLAVGDVFDLIAASPSLASQSPVKRFARVAGKFRSGLFEYDSTWIYLDLRFASALAGAPDTASVLSVKVRDIYDVKRVAAGVRASLGDSFMTVDWQDANRPLFAALALERKMGLFIIGLIILIGALNITTTLILVVIERRKEIAVLNALGATGKGILTIFLWQGAIIGAVGAVLGGLLGVISCLLGNRYRLISLPADVYSIGYVPFSLHFRDLLIAMCLAVFLSVVATLYPANAATRVRPGEILKDA